MTLYLYPSPACSHIHTVADPPPPPPATCGSDLSLPPAVLLLRPVPSCPPPHPSSPPPPPQASTQFPHLEEHARFLDNRTGGFARFGNLVASSLVQQHSPLEQVWRE